MGYNISKHSVIRNKPQLDDMLELRKTFEIPTAHPRRLSAKLWEAIRSAEALAKRYPEFEKYAELAGLYRLRQTKTGVRCEWISEQVDSTLSDPSPPPASPKPLRMDYPEAVTLVDVIASAMSFEEVPEIRFPNAVLTESDKQKLYEWTQRDGVKWAFISHDDAGLTLTTREVPEEILWRSDATT